ncbi:MAG: membrane protein insertase YidC [Candidatus Cohnella colombiensis]|uniref:Membrane protein insertase YidC n=1 Tax=Candidatus Cohnella colombiensis TaxID=3121368 RepID=A0AA95EZR2_9BACL|nr:MAG: membrane protein insertase YidC [Cohnella sp.]
MLRNRKWWTVFGALSLLIVLSGCTSNIPAITTEQMLEKGWWTRNVVYYFSKMLDTFSDWFGGSYGLAILLLTIIVRTIILPLMIKQYKNTKAMQKLQPEMKKIREKYKDDTRTQQEEMMKLYQTHQVNPLAGCFPLIVQMPIFIALYTSINTNAYIKGLKDEAGNWLIHESTFLWLSLGEVDKTYILPIIAAITTFIQSKMMASTQPMQGPMKGLMFIFPVLIFVMAISFPAALPLYWIYSNIYTIIQNYFLYKPSRKDAATAAINLQKPDNNSPKPKRKKGKGAHAK